jgi:hypothetical protein
VRNRDSSRFACAERYGFALVAALTAICAANVFDAPLGKFRVMTDSIASRSLGRRCLFIGAAILALLALVGSASAQTWQDATDYTKLKLRLGVAAPTGAGGAISIVEAANGAGAYYVDLANPEYLAAGDPFNTALNLTDGSDNAGNGTSPHATFTVGANYFGNFSSMAPGANNVTIYEVNDWLNSRLNYGGTSPPQVPTFRVQNHSWIAVTLGNDSQDLAAVRRFDYLIETTELTGVVGANNNGNPANLLAHPHVMVHSYNSIVVGRPDGSHSRGQTVSFYGPGRFKPDMVAPGAFTSISSARVSSAATLLHETGAGTDAVRSETMKAILLAGATKQEFANWVDPTTGLVNPWSRTATRPLDDVFGAGELNIYNSYLSQLGGKQSASLAVPSSAVGSYGYDYQNRKGEAVGDLFYKFNVASGSTAQELSIVLAWNAEITDTNPGMPFDPQESLQNLDMRLYTADENVFAEPIDPLRTSVSTTDNVEHIYLTDLAPGTYTLKVSGAANWDYGLAWRMSTLFDEPSGDFDANGLVNGSDFLTWQRNLGRLLGATHSQGDADGDGDVDTDDLAVLNMAGVGLPGSTAGSGAGSVVGGGAASSGAVPEPASFVSLAAGLLLLAVRLRKRCG